ncbi:MAG: DNA repair and recombination protein RadB [Candidatus Pacearchaeota archaeon]
MKDIELEGKNKEYFKTKIPTGSRDLNLWLSGGYDKGVITLFYGPAASGKSNFTMLASSFLARENKKVIYIDTEGSFSLDRIRQISGVDCYDVLKNIIILKPLSFYEQKKIFLKLFRESRSKNISLIVVDSMTMLYRLDLAEAKKKGLKDVEKINYDLLNQMKSLHEIAIKRNIPILITAQVYSNFLSEEDFIAGKEASVNVVGGDILKYWSKCIIEFQNKNGRKKAILRKHRSLPEREFNFLIVNEGIVKKRFFSY